MFSSLTSFLNLRTPQLTTNTKRKWESNETVNREEQDPEVVDYLQTPPNKRVRQDNSNQENITPLGKVAFWVKETARKTVRIFRSFTDKYSVIEDEVDDDSADEISPVFFNTSAMEQRNLLQDSRQCVPEKEGMLSYRMRTSRRDGLARRPLHEPSYARRKAYDPSKYDRDQSEDPLRNEFWPSTSNRAREGAGSQAAEMKTSKNVRKSRANGSEKPQDMKLPKNNRTGTMVDTVVRLREREQYRQLLAHYTSVGQKREECCSIGTRSADLDLVSHKTNSTELSPLRNSRQDQSLINPSLLTQRPSRTAPREMSPVVRPQRLQVSPSRPSFRATDISGTFSTNVTGGMLQSERNYRQSTSTRQSDLLEDSWIKKWKEALSSESLERERKILKEKLRLEAIRKERDDFDLISENVKARMQGKQTVPVPEEKVDSFPKLTSEMNCMVDKALGHGAPNEYLVETSIGRITRGDIATLGQQNWLNDEIINIYFHMIADRSKKGGPNIHSFNSFFYSKLIKTGHASLRRWTKKVDLFTMDMVLVPVHLGMHWCLAVIDFKGKIISYYDSLKGENRQCLQALRDYVCAESLDKKKTTFDLTGWKYDTPQNIPEQMNGCDCGVFICKYAEYISRRAKFDFTQYDMPYFRRRMVYEILSGTLL